MPGQIRVTPEELSALGTECAKASDAIATALNALNKQMNTTLPNWEGQASGKFQGEWATHSGNLGKAQLAINELGTAASKLAENYVAADQSYGSA